MKQLKRTELVKTVTILAIIIIGSVGFVLGLRTALKTQFPLMVVASESMVPALRVGDIIMVQGGQNASEITADPVEGDIIVFREPGYSNDLIVHRAIEKTKVTLWYFKTKGDNNLHPDYWPGFPEGIPENYIVGQVIGRLPLFGYLFLFLRTPGGLIVFVIAILLLVFQEYFSMRRKKTKSASLSPQPENG